MYQSKRISPYRLLAALILFGVVVGVAGCSGSGSSSSTTSSTPTISSFSPTGGATVGGTTVTITGTNFVSVSNVLFGALPAASYVVVSSTQINAVAPAGNGSVLLSVSTPNGTALTGLSDFYTYGTTSGTAPAIASITPTALPAGATVTITGTGFTGVAAVYFGTTSASYTVNSATSITATVPNLGTTSSSENVSVVTSAGTSNAVVWSYSG